jgi:hypothetical protein
MTRFADLDIEELVIYCHDAGYSISMPTDGTTRVTKDGRTFKVAGNSQQKNLAALVHSINTVRPERERWEEKV